MCRRGQGLRMRHGVPDVEMIVLSRHKHSLLALGRQRFVQRYYYI